MDRSATCRDRAIFSPIHRVDLSQLDEDSERPRLRDDPPERFQPSAGQAFFNSLSIGRFGCLNHLSVLRCSPDRN